MATQTKKKKKAKKKFTEGYKTYDESSRTADGQRDQRVNSKRGIQPPGADSPEHNKLAVSDVQHPGNTVLQAEPDGDEGKDAAQQQTTNHYIQKCNKHNDSFPW